MKPIKKILYVSSLCSPQTLVDIFKISKIKPPLAIQKFHRLLVEGFSFQSEFCSIESLGAIPVTPASHKKRIWILPAEVVGKIKYTYVPLINVPVIKNTGVFLYSFFKVVFWGLGGGTKDKIVVCDILALSITAATLLACKVIRIKTVAIVTDMPHLMVDNLRQSRLVRKLFNRLVVMFMCSYDGYILLTEQMNECVNIQNKPYIVMEGLVDTNMVGTSNVLEKKNTKKILLYAGGIHEKYGILTLIEAFMRLRANDIRLHIYGPGPMAKKMPRYMELDQRIVYYGTVLNKEVVEKELEATLLINPRPSTEELTLYSFPSKNMEYMVSGTPLLTTPLPGMPDEYKQYVYLFYDESTEGMHQILRTILAKSDEVLHEFGNRAKQFVLMYKSNDIQARRILCFLEKI